MYRGRIDKSIRLEYNKTNIRLDILCSLLQKSIRRQDYYMAIYSLVFLCKCGHEYDAAKILHQSCIEDTNAMTEPKLRRHIIEIYREMNQEYNIIHRWRRGETGVQEALPFLYEILVELILAYKSHLSLHAMQHTYNNIIIHMKDIKISLDIKTSLNKVESDSVPFRQELLRQFKKKYNEFIQSGFCSNLNALGALEYGLLLDIYASKDIAYGTFAIWNFLNRHGHESIHINDMMQFINIFSNLYDTSYFNTLALTESILYVYSPIHKDVTDIPSKRFPDQVALLDKIFHEQLLEPPMLQSIDKYKCYIYDVTTAAGRGNITDIGISTSLFDTTQAIKNPSCVSFEFQHAQKINNQILCDPFESTAKTFLYQLEKNQHVVCKQLPSMNKSYHNMVAWGHVKNIIVAWCKHVFAHDQMGVYNRRRMKRGMSCHR